MNHYMISILPYYLLIDFLLKSTTYWNKFSI